jgi:very-short-patch-repair endonuclease
LAELARRQHGVVGRRQLRRLGLTEGEIRWRLESGRLHRLQGGVYAVGHRDISRLGRWMAAVLASGPEAVLSHWSAAALWQIRPNSRSRIDVTVPHSSRSSPLIVRHVSQIPEDERATVEAIAVTSVPRTVLDLAATQPSEVIESLLREIEFQRLYDRLSLHHLVDRYPGRRGVGKVLSALQRLESDRPGRRRSPLEEGFARYLRRHRLPLPRFNDWVVLDAKRFQVDCHWPGTGLVVELDGWEGHGTRSAFRNDRARDRALSVAGYSVTRLTWRQLKDEPEAIAADLRALLGS